MPDCILFSLFLSGRGGGRDVELGKGFSAGVAPALTARLVVDLGRCVTVGLDTGSASFSSERTVSAPHPDVVTPSSSKQQSVQRTVISFAAEPVHGRPS